MIVEQKNNEILDRISAGTNVPKIQAILDYLRFEELASKSDVTEIDVQNLTKESKVSR